MSILQVILRFFYQRDVFTYSVCVLICIILANLEVDIFVVPVDLVNFEHMND